MRNKILEKLLNRFIFLTTPTEIKKYVEMMHFSLSDNCVCYFNIKILNLFDPELQLINTILIIKNKSKVLLN